MHNIEQLARDLVDQTGTFIFPEYYPHTNKVMWKILNPYTKWAEDKLVLVGVEEENSIERALQIALTSIALKKDEWDKHPEWHK